jgi:hypothetical protein
MLKHKGFPSRLPSTDFQFTIRRANKDGATKLIARERYADRRPADRRADAAFVEALWLYFGEEPFERGNLDAGRLSWLFGREVIPAEDPFDPESYEALLHAGRPRARAPSPRPSTAAASGRAGPHECRHELRAPSRFQRFGAQHPARSIHRLYRSRGHGMVIVSAQVPSFTRADRDKTCYPSPSMRSGRKLSRPHFFAETRLIGADALY